MTTCRGFGAVQISYLLHRGGRELPAKVTERASGAGYPLRRLIAASSPKGRAKGRVPRPKGCPFPSLLKGTAPNAMYISLKGNVNTCTPGDASPGGVWGGGSIAGAIAFKPSPAGFFGDFLAGAVCQVKCNT